MDRRRIRGCMLGLLLGDYEKKGINKGIEYGETM